MTPWQEVLSDSGAGGADLVGPLFWPLLGAYLCQTLQWAAFDWGICAFYEQSETLEQDRIGLYPQFPPSLELSDLFIW